jgi:hypothetical protein
MVAGSPESSGPAHTTRTSTEMLGFFVFRVVDDFALFAVLRELCDTSVLLELKRYRKERKGPQSSQGDVYKNRRYTIVSHPTNNGEKIHTTLQYKIPICRYLPHAVFPQILNTHFDMGIKKLK